MATISDAPAQPVDPTAPNLYERFLALAALALLGCVAAALAKGYPRWEQVPWQVWPHLATVVLALVLTPVMLLRRRGDPAHRLLGKVWVLAMTATALLSFNVRGINHGGFSLIHVLSAFTVIQAPLIWWHARNHRIAQHRQSVRMMVTGALIVAGVFTFPFGRLLGSWLFG